MFSGKTQEERQKELDTDFLNAVAGHNFGKAKKLLNKGANILAKDAEDNTTLHKLATNARKVASSVIDENVCFLLNQGVDINARNKQGKTCLHVAAANDEEYDTYHYDDCSPTDQVRILLNRGADPNIADAGGMTPLFDASVSEEESLKKAEEMIEIGAQLDAKDNLGRTALHIAAAKGNQDVVDLYLEKEPSLIEAQDNEGKYPYQSAIEGAAGHHALSRELLAKLEEYNKEKKYVEARKESTDSIAESVRRIEEITEKGKEMLAAQEQAAAVPVTVDDGWLLLKPEQVEHTEKMSNYRLTHIFNFSARTYTHITHNLETKADIVDTKSFDDFADKTILEEAHRELTRLGGKVDESVIRGPVIAKGKASPSL